MAVIEPMTPPDCDLRGLPFMPLDVSRLVDSDLMALSTGDEFKAAVTLWCKSWLQVPAASLPDDDRVLAHLTGSGPRWRKLKAMALHGWQLCADGRWYHPVIAEKAREAWKHRQSQRARANKRWGNAGDDDGGTAAAPASGNATAHATASPAAMQGTGRGTGTEAGDADASPAERARARRLPADWLPGELSGSAAAVAQRRGAGWLERALEGFRNHWAADGGRKLDWNATWRNWIVRQDEYDGQRDHRGGRQGAQHPGGRTGAAADDVFGGMAGADGR